MFILSFDSATATPLEKKKSFSTGANKCYFKCSFSFSEGGEIQVFLTVGVARVCQQQLQAIQAPSYYINAPLFLYTILRILQNCLLIN